jgi:hypothetical protein
MVESIGSYRRDGLAVVRRRLKRTAPRVIAAMVFAAIVAALALPSLLQPEPTTRSVSRGVGTVGFSFQAPGVKAPTGRKPEASKLWVADGSWWGVLFDRSRDAYMMYRFDWDADTWIATGQMVDDRNFSRADVVWDGTYLYTVSGCIDPASAKHRALLSRFSYDAAFASGTSIEASRSRSPMAAPRPSCSTRQRMASSGSPTRVGDRST